MNYSRRFGVVPFLLSILYVGCSTVKTRSVLPTDKKKWGDYSRCLTAGYFQVRDGVQITVFMNEGSTSADSDVYPSLMWVYHTKKDIQLDFIDTNPQVEFRLYPGPQSIKKNIHFLVRQTMNKNHPEIPKGMTTEYDYKRSVMKYGKERRIWWGLGPIEFKIFGELKSPRYFTRHETSQKVDGRPDAGYDLDDMYASYSLKEVEGKTKSLDYIEAILPSYYLNGILVPSETFRFNYSDKGRNSDRNCNYWQSSFPGYLQVLFYRLNPWSN